MNFSPQKRSDLPVTESQDRYHICKFLMFTDRLPRWIAYAFAVATSLTMLFLRMQLAVSMGQRPLLILFVAPIILSSLLGGIGPGLIATAIAALGIDYYGIPPLHSFRIQESHDLFQWIMLIVSGILCSVLSELLHRARRQSEERRIFQETVQEKLQKSEERYRILIENSLQGIALLKGFPPVFVYVNPGCTEIFGYTADEVLSFDSEAIWNIVHPEDRAMVKQRNRDRLMGISAMPSYQFRIIRKDGATRWIETFVNMIPFDNGSPVIQATYIDITERKEAEKARTDLELKLRQVQKAESLGRMAGAIAHHFNNQLYVVMGNLEMALDGLSQDSDTFRYMTESMKAAGKVAQISSLMLTYLGQTPGKKEPLDLSGVCRQNLPLLQASLPKEITFKADLPASGPFIHSNTSQLQKILANLVANASEAIGENSGSIDISVKTVASEHIPDLNRFPVDWHPKERIYACLEVSDTGCGIATEDIVKLFDPFFTTKFTGRGLGLPTVLGMVGTQCGGITVESSVGRGSIFRVFLPVSAEAVAISLEKTGGIPEITGAGTVLVVEDDPMVRNMARIMLGRLGYSALEAKDGVEAVEVFQQHQHEIRCVLSDLTMPRMDGWETLAALRGISPKIPVILSSGYDEAQVMAEDHLERPDAFLGKPYQIKVLGEIINRVLANNEQ
jgi:PAS domain S-box-containing protein